MKNIPSITIAGARNISPLFPNPVIVVCFVFPVTSFISKKIVPGCIPAAPRNYLSTPFFEFDYFINGNASACAVFNDSAADLFSKTTR